MLLKYRKIIREAGDNEGYVVLLEDGRCAYVNIETGYVDVDILISSMMTCGSLLFCDIIDKEIEKKIIKTLENPNSIHISSSAEDYITNSDFKNKIDELSKDFIEILG